MAKKKTTSKKPTLASLRRQLDRLDQDILSLMNERASLALQIGPAKQADGQVVYDPGREAEVLQRMVDRNPGPLSGASVEAVYRELISGSRALQVSMQVAYLGPLFTYSHLAAIHRFGQSASLIPVATIEAVFEEVERGHAQFGLVPMENSTDGRISDTLDCFSRASERSSTVRICGELPLRIHHYLLGRGDRRDVQVVASKPQALSQCRNWLAEHLPQAQLVEVASTAEAAVRAKRESQTAAIASKQAGINHQLPVLASKIEDQPNNITRFAVIGTTEADPTGQDKTSLMFEVSHEPGALADAMTIFKRNRLNMTWIESFPIPDSGGRYLFFIEFLGHQVELRARRAIASLEKKAVRLEVLGSYAQTEPIG